MKLLIVALIVLNLSACQSEEEKHDSIMIDQCIMKLKSIAKDHNSIKFTEKPSVIIVGKKSGNEYKAVMIRYNAKNSFGAYVGEDVFYCKEN